MSGVRRFNADAAGDYGWRDVERLRYKAEGSAPFKDITRQVLFAQADQGCELRYFEVAAGGYSTLERHEHTHAVLILRGRGTVRLGTEVHALAERDLVLDRDIRPDGVHFTLDSATGLTRELIGPELIRLALG